MAGNYFNATSGPVSTGAALKTLATVQAPSGTGLRVGQWGVSFDGTSPTGAKIPVELWRGMTGGTATTTANVQKTKGHSGSIQSTIKENYTAEPTGGNVLAAQLVHPQSGVANPADIVLAPGEVLAIRTNALVAVNARAFFTFEE